MTASNLRQRNRPELPLRSALFVPGIQPRMLEKARESTADAIWIDLEDATPPDRKAEARQLTRAAVGQYQQATYVRVNALATLMTSDDLAAVVSPALTGIVLAKTNSAADIAVVDHLLSVAEQRAGCQVGSIKVHVSIESVEGILNCREIFRSPTGRVSGATIGTARDGDMQRGLGYLWSPEGTETLYIRSRMLAEAKGANLVSIMQGPFVEHQNDDGLLFECRIGRQLGYMGKSAIHPRQVDLINQAFTPSDEELAYYGRLVAAMEDAYRRGKAAATFEGKMVDTAHLLRAKEVLAAVALRSPSAGKGVK